ncbi:MAG TPA: hypothetical protein VN976_24175 [Verrucomicrobiae bacterium]|nr:hypothetical protein [Verrucomicrobiae bacterium]
MTKSSTIRSGVRWLGVGAGLAIVAYASSVGITWCLYGHPKRKGGSETGESLLDQFIPDYEVVERHSMRVTAPAGIAFEAACEMNIHQSATVRAIFRTRALVLRSDPQRKARLLGLVEQARTWGWGVLAELPGREIVFGVVTQPWRANPIFRALPPAEFREFNDPGYVKIAWTLSSDPINPTKSIIRTETRATTTDPGSRAKFRRYWSLVMPGTILIRRIGLRLVKTEAERRARGAIERENV